MELLQSVRLAVWLTIVVALSALLPFSRSLLALTDTPLGDLMSFGCLYKILHGATFELLSLLRLNLQLLCRVSLAIFILCYVLPNFVRYSDNITDRIDESIHCMVVGSCESVKSYIVAQLALPSRLTKIESAVQNLHDLVRATLSHSSRACCESGDLKNLPSNRSTKVLRRQLKNVKRRIGVHQLKAAKNAIVITNLTAEISSLNDIIPLLISFWAKASSDVRTSTKRYIQLKQLLKISDEQRTSSNKRYMQLKEHFDTFEHPEGYRKSLETEKKENTRLRVQIEHLTRDSASFEKTTCESRSMIDSLRSNATNLSVQLCNLKDEKQLQAIDLQKTNQKLLRQKDEEMLALQGEHAKALQAKDNEINALRKKMTTAILQKDEEMSALRTEITTITTLKDDEISDLRKEAISKDTEYHAQINALDKSRPNNEKVSAAQEQLASQSKQYEQNIIQLTKRLEDKTRFLEIADSKLEAIDEEWSQTYHAIADSNSYWESIGRRFGKEKSDCDDTFKGSMQADLDSKHI